MEMVTSAKEKNGRIRRACKVPDLHVDYQNLPFFGLLKKFCLCMKKMAASRTKILFRHFAAATSTYYYLLARAPPPALSAPASTALVLSTLLPACLLACLPPSLPSSPLAPSRKLCPPGENALNVFAAASHDGGGRGRTHFCRRRRRRRRVEISPTNPTGYGEGDRHVDYSGRRKGRLEGCIHTADRRTSAVFVHIKVGKPAENSTM